MLIFFLLVDFEDTFRSMLNFFLLVEIEDTVKSLQ